MNTYQQAQTGTKLLELSDFFSRLPFLGRWLRNRLIHKSIPLSGTLNLDVRHLVPGHCITAMSERTRLQHEHYGLHESAISALAEHSARLALLTGLPDQSSATLTAWNIQFMKVGHGLLSAECQSELPDSGLTKEHSQLIEVVDETGSIVARAASTWLIRHEGKMEFLES